MSYPDTFHSLVVRKDDTSFSVQVEEMTLDALPEGEVLIHVEYSSINYKDGLACTPNGKIVRSYPFIPGIDLAGTVAHSTDARFHDGDPVLVTGYNLGVSHFGGFSEYARVPADWVVPLPSGLSAKEAMVFGTAGFTAALSVYRLQSVGVTPDKGPVLVTGATGGVGSVAVALLAHQGYEVVASTGKMSEAEYLRQLGVKEMKSRSETSAESPKPLEKELWAGAVDPVGGSTLSYLLRTTRYGGAVAVSGLTGGTDVHTSVFPFILRGVNLLGIDSVFCPMDVRREVWAKLATEWKPKAELFEAMTNREIGLEGIPDAFPLVLQGQMRGRVVVKV
ncbi:NADPH:quinone oxidoreductase family protein [Alicyclobacillus ferrooxydans]|uniref:Quinone oxidoreductase n=1 Tax=Alicyclobacillus ferrooxydans TaxID=471514 RepID=A0A0P9CBA2_9BACL|nr:acryloyl-CoA reductase [Alicyclobacillus ferrooxydans]KPV42713.1 quinone oxidoreductase [Alicyclobacillus ferrooxydans]